MTRFNDGIVPPHETVYRIPDWDSPKTHYTNDPLPSREYRVRPDFKPNVNVFRISDTPEFQEVPKQYRESFFSIQKHWITRETKSIFYHASANPMYTEVHGYWVHYVTHVWGEWKDA